MCIYLERTTRHDETGARKERRGRSKRPKRRDASVLPFSPLRACSLSPRIANEHTDTPLLSVPGTSIPDLMGNPYWPLPRWEYEGCETPLALKLFPSPLLQGCRGTNSSPLTPPSIADELALRRLSNRKMQRVKIFFALLYVTQSFKFGVKFFRIRTFRKASES